MEYPTAMGSLLQAFHRAHECGEGKLEGSKKSSHRQVHGNLVFLLL